MIKYIVGVILICFVVILAFQAINDGLYINRLETAINDSHNHDICEARELGKEKIVRCLDYETGQVWPTNIKNY